MQRPGVAPTESNSPVVALGDQDSPTVTLPDGRYLISIRSPDHKMWGKHITLPDDAGTVDIALRGYPPGKDGFPLGKIRAFVFEDMSWANSAPDATEAGLEGFHITIDEQTDQHVTVDYFNNPLCGGALRHRRRRVRCSSTTSVPATYFVYATPPDELVQQQPGQQWVQTSTFDGSFNVQAGVEEGSDGTGAPGEQLWEPPNVRTGNWFGFAWLPDRLRQPRHGSRSPAAPSTGSAGRRSRPSSPIRTSPSRTRTSRSATDDRRQVYIGQGDAGRHLRHPERSRRHATALDLGRAALLHHPLRDGDRGRRSTSPSSATSASRAGSAGSRATSTRTTTGTASAMRASRRSRTPTSTSAGATGRSRTRPSPTRTVTTTTRRPRAARTASGSSARSASAATRPPAPRCTASTRPSVPPRCRPTRAAACSPTRSSPRAITRSWTGASRLPRGEDRPDRRRRLPRQHAQRGQRLPAGARGLRARHPRSHGPPARPRPRRPAEHRGRPDAQRVHDRPLAAADQLRHPGLRRQRDHGPDDPQPVPGAEVRRVAEPQRADEGRRVRRRLRLRRHVPAVADPGQSDRWHVPVRRRRPRPADRRQVHHAGRDAQDGQGHDLYQITKEEDVNVDTGASTSPRSRRTRAPATTTWCRRTTHQRARQDGRQAPQALRQASDHAEEQAERERRLLPLHRERRRDPGPRHRPRQQRRLHRQRPAVDLVHVAAPGAGRPGRHLRPRAHARRASDHDGQHGRER